MNRRHRWYRLAFRAACIHATLLAPDAVIANEQVDSPRTRRGVIVEVPPADEAPGGEVRLYRGSYALVIGIDDYTGGWIKLRNAVRDAELVSEALVQRGFEVDLLLNPTSEALKQGIQSFLVSKGGDKESRLLIWFAGHGHTKNEEAFLVPADAPPSDDPRFAIVALQMRVVADWVRLAQAKHVFGIFDSCFGGSILEYVRGEPPPAISQRTADPARQFLTSGDADQQVSDDGVFRELFLAALRKDSQADMNKDGYLTASELSVWMAQRVTNLTQGTQTPRFGKLRDPKYDRGDFVFVLNGDDASNAPLESPPSPLPPDDLQRSEDGRTLYLVPYEILTQELQRDGTDISRRLASNLKRAISTSLQALPWDRSLPDIGFVRLSVPVEVTNVEQMTDLGRRLNALGMISGEVSLEKNLEGHMTVEVSSQYQTIPAIDVLHPATFYVDDSIPPETINSVHLVDHISHQWGACTVVALALRDLANQPPDASSEELHRIRRYLVAQRSQCGPEDRAIVNQIDLLVNYLDERLVR